MEMQTATTETKVIDIAKVRHARSRDEAVKLLAEQTGLTVVTELPPDFNIRTHGVAETIHLAGDLKIIWDRNKPHEVEAARTMFNAMVTQGYAAFKVKDNDGNKGDKISEFDPNVERLVMIAPMQGG